LFAILLFAAANFLSPIISASLADKLKLQDLTEHNLLANKLLRFLSSSANPDCVVIGSSLTITPAVRCDDAESGWVGARSDDYINSYDRAIYLQRLLSRAGIYTIANLSVSGALVSDQWIILNRELECGKRPKLIIYGISPRDFIDRFRSNPLHTPTLAAIGNLRLLPDLAATRLYPADAREFLCGALCHIYKPRSFYKSTIASIFFLPDASSAAQVSPHQRKPVSRSAFIAEQSAEYKRRYNPLDENLYRAETAFFNRFLSIARENNERVAVVVMPLTAANRNSLPPKFEWQWRQMLKRACQRNDARLIDVATTTPFTDEDFEDSCHLNLRGGKKLFEAISAAIIGQTSPK